MSGNIIPEDKSLEYYFIYHKQKQQNLLQTSLLLYSNYFRAQGTGQLSHMVQEVCQCNAWYPCRCSCLPSGNMNVQPWQGLKSQHLCSYYSCDWPVLPFFISYSKPLLLALFAQVRWCLSMMCNSCTGLFGDEASVCLCHMFTKKKRKQKSCHKLWCFPKLWCYWLKGTLTMKKPCWLG